MILCSVVLQIFPLSPDTLSVYVDGEFTTVYVKNGRLLCSCPTHRGGCKFVHAVTKALRQDSKPDYLAVIQDQLDGKNVTYRAVMQQVSHSTRSINVTKQV